MLLPIRWGSRPSVHASWGCLIHPSFITMCMRADQLPPIDLCAPMQHIRGAEPPGDTEDVLNWAQWPKKIQYRPSSCGLYYPQTLFYIVIKNIWVYSLCLKEKLLKHLQHFKGCDEEEQERWGIITCTKHLRWSGFSFLSQDKMWKGTDGGRAERGRLECTSDERVRTRTTFRALWCLGPRYLRYHLHQKSWSTKWQQRHVASCRNRFQTCLIIWSEACFWWVLPSFTPERNILKNYCY